MRGANLLKHGILVSRTSCKLGSLGGSWAVGGRVEVQWLLLGAGTFLGQSPLRLQADEWRELRHLWSRAPLQ